MDGQDSDLGPDQRLAALAARQFGVFDLVDARACGFGSGAIDRRVANGRWLRLHRSVYALGHAQLTVEGRRFAAVRACGRRAVLSHRSAAATWGLVAPGGSIHVTIPDDVRRSPPSPICVHTSAALGPDAVTRIGPLPVTTVARTLVDLAPSLTPRRLEDAVNQAELLGLYDGWALHAMLDAHPTRAGVAALRALLADLRGVGAPRTRSELERAFLELCDTYNLPTPAANARVHGVEVDFFWPEANLVVETDGWMYHRMPGRREADAAKRLALEAAGLRVIVLTWRQVVDKPAATAAALRAVLTEVPPHPGR